MAGVVLDLLVAGEDGPTSQNGRALAAGILHSRQCMDKEAQKLVESLSLRVSECDGELSLMVEALESCSPLTLAQNFTAWTGLLTRVLQATTDPAVFQVVLNGVSVLVKRVTTSSLESRQQLDSQQLSPLLHTLLCFSSGEATLQAMVLRLVAHCLVHANSSCSQHRPSLKKWASAVTFHSHLPLAQEGSRVLVLLCRHSNQQWGGLLECVLTGLEWTLDQLHKSSSTSRNGGRGSAPKTLSSWLDLPPLPSTDPDRSACLVQVLSHLGRLIRYSLLFPPSDPSLPPAVPMERILADVSHGLRPAPSGHVVEALVLQAALPVVHVTMWNVLCVLITTCHAHLLPYAGHVTSLLTTALCCRDPDQSPSLLAAVHRTLTQWVGVARDCNLSSLGPWLRALLWSYGHTPFRVSSLEALGAVIGSVGPLVAPPLAPSILQVPMTGLTPSSPAQEALLMLQLLMACVTSGNAKLCPPASAAVQLLSEVASHHPSREVVDSCRLALSHCCSLNSPLLHPQTSSTDPPDSPMASPATFRTLPSISLATPLASTSTSLATPVTLPSVAAPSISLATSIAHPIPTLAPTNTPRPLIAAPTLTPTTDQRNMKRKRFAEIEGTGSATKRKPGKAQELRGLTGGGKELTGDGEELSGLSGSREELRGLIEKEERVFGTEGRVSSIEKVTKDNMEAGSGLNVEEDIAMTGERGSSRKEETASAPVTVMRLDLDSESSDEGAASGMELFVADSSGISDDDCC